MSKTSRAMLQLGVALVMSLAAGVLIFKWMAARPAPVARPAIARTIPVVVAAKDLPAGIKLSADMLAIAPYLDQSLPQGHFQNASQLVGRVLHRATGAREPVTASRLMPDDVAGGGVSAMVRPGMRAMAVKGDKVMGLSGFVRPGNRVDVLVTLVRQGSENRRARPVTKVVLENVPVLAAGNELTTDPADGQTSSVDVYTLELTPAESERLALAATHGTLHFALRNGGDNATVLTHGVEPHQALASYRPPRKVRKRVVVELITGSKTTTMKF